MRFLRTNTATRITVGPFYDKTDGVTPETALTVTNCKLTSTVDDAGVPTLVLDTNPTASGGANDMVHITGDDAGYYDLELAAANVNYLGRMSLALTDAANHCPVFHEFMIVPGMIYDFFFLGTDRMDVNVTHVGDTAQTAGDIMADTNDIQSRLPAALVGGRMDSSVGAMAANVLTATAINADAITAAKVAADVTTELQTGLATAAALSTLDGKVDVIDDFLDTEIAAIKAKTDNLPSDPADASDIAGAFTTVNTKLDTIDDFLDTEIAAIKAKTDNLPADPADASDIASSFSTVNTKLDTIDDFLDTEVAAIKAKTDNLPSDPADESLIIAATDAIMTRVGAPVGASISADIAGVKTQTAAIETDTQDIQSRLPAALTSDGNMKADTLRISGSAESADRLERSTLGITTGTVGAAATTTSIPTSSLSPAASVADQFKGRIVTFDKDTATAGLRGQSTDITANTSGGVLAVTALTTAPASGDTFVIT